MALMKETSILLSPASYADLSANFTVYLFVSQNYNYLEASGA